MKKIRTPSRGALPVAPADSGETRSARDRLPQSPQPHEHDESSHSQVCSAPIQREIGQQAYADTQKGQPNTDRAPVVDKVYNEKIAPDRGSRPPRP